MSYATVHHWSALMGVRPTPYEVEALMELDAILTAPAERKREQGDG